MHIGNIDVAYLAQKYGTPLYVYDFQRIRENAQRLVSAFHRPGITVKPYYAMKANPHPAILQIMLEMGFGVDCVSPGEVEVATHVGFPPERILYTGNYESYDDLRVAYYAGVQINLDDLASFERLLRIGTPEMISFRINPGQGRGRYHQITTAGEKAKFGMPPERAKEAYRQAQMAGVQAFGAHMMTGSGILDAEYFPRMLKLLLDILHHIRQELNIQFHFIDMGGGLGIPYYGDENELDVERVGRESTALFAQLVAQYQLGTPSLLIEPGRYLVGDAGYLIARVTSIKRAQRTFVGVDAGFNTLIRPALYGAKHTIVVNDKEHASAMQPVTICGQICENTDIFTTDYPLPEVSEGDLLIFKQAGAYGCIMAMPYNHRLRPAEVAIVQGKDILITRREEMRDYWQRITYPQL